MKMKAFKRFSSFLLALVMIMAMTISVSASTVTSGENEEPKGTITISNTIKDQTYSIYKIFDLESYNADTNAYSYKVADPWKAFVTGEGEGASYVTVNDQDYVTWNEGADAAEFAKKALAYAKANDIAPTGDPQTAQADNEKLTFAEIDLGYYLVDSSMGTICSLDTTNPTVDIQEKNEKPNLEKEVKNEDGQWDKENNVKIGDTVEFRAIITAQPGAQNYVMHDKMSAGLTYKEVTSVTLKKAGATEETEGNVVESKNYTVVDTGLKDGCTFEVAFTKAFCDTLGKNDTITVYYSAVLNENAVIAGTGNPNEAKLSYGEESKNETTPSTTTTYTFDFDLVKTTGENDNQEFPVLSGAKFKLYDSETGGKEIELVKEENGTTYHVATPEEKAADGFTAAEIEAGHVTIEGLAIGTYWLEETQAPDGYNKLAGRVEVKIETDDSETTNPEDKKYVVKSLEATVTDGNWTEGGIHVINNTGAELPSTGGIGTTIFYVVGGILVVAAAILLVVKKRMSHQS